MKKLLTLFAVTLITGSLIAGGLVTNTNQSALYTRLQSRNASTLIDAVYYNPAGLTKLGTGLFVSLNNQTIGQTKSVLNDYLLINGTPKDYIGKVSAPLFPGVYAAFNLGKFSISAGVNPIGGGGGAKYDDGLPSFEMQIANLKPLLVQNGIPTTQYSTEIFFEGTSVYMGYQVNFAYKINDMISVAAGLRMVSAKNTYNGSMENISINPNFPAFGAAYNGTMVFASDFFGDGAEVLSGLATGATAYSAVIQGRITGGVAPATLLSDGATNGLTPAQIVTIQQIMGAAGQTPEQIGAASIGYAQAVLGAAAPVFTGQSVAMSGYEAQTQDVYVDADETGMGYSPIISVNISPIENLNIALKYEFKTNLELTTKVYDNKGGGVFFEGDKVIADMPAMLAAGVEFRPIERLMVTGSYNYYFDKDVDYDGSEDLDINMIDKNFTEYALGAEFGISDMLKVSAGWLGTVTGVNADYQNDQRFSLNTNSFGGGIGVKLTPMINLNLGGQYTMYKEDFKEFEDSSTGLGVKEIYNKDTWVVGVGLDLMFGK